MYLKNIKLSGFKSFVDPTIIPVRKAINSIVGPNGCGKSNVVDAIRWVIGESSAKQLRGQSMSDVIFNGTNARKPVGKASVELIFDNSEGRIVGEYAQFNEISVRREITRDGQSAYFINGIHCRRRDVIDIFLGTGLGPNSYAIIEQGMISQLIEAKPDELRTYLEEAAGISKYRERRRETENRMRHTQENLERLNDLREELERQLRHLKRQANAAERYKELKLEESLLHAQIKGLQWQTLQLQLQSNHEMLNQQTIVHEEKLTEQRQVETQIEKGRVEQNDLAEKQSAIQKRYYSLGAEIARIEQQIQHIQEQTKDWQNELNKTENFWQELTQNLATRKQQIISVNDEQQRLRPEVHTLKESAHKSASLLNEAETAMQQWQEQWNNFQNQSGLVMQQLEVAKTKIENYQQQHQRLHDRIQNLEQQCESQIFGTLSEEIERLSQEMHSLNDKQQEIKTGLEEVTQNISDQRANNQEMRQELRKSRHELQLLEGRHASLETLQQAALGLNDVKSSEWLVDHDLNHRTRLAKAIHVTSGWELAVETVLNNYFDAVCLDDIEQYIPQMHALDSGHVTLLDKNVAHNSATFNKARTLISQVNSEWPLSSWLNGIYIAETLDEANHLRKNLSPGESVITKEAVWLGPNWARISKAFNPEDSILLREQELERLQAEIAEKTDELDDSENLQKQNESYLADLEIEREKQYRILQEQGAVLSETKAQLARRESRLAELQAQQQRQTKELIEYRQQLENCLAALKSEQEQLQQHEQNRLSQDELKEQLTASRLRFAESLQIAQQVAKQDQQKWDEVEVRISMNDKQLELLKQTIDQTENQLAQLTERRQQLSQDIENSRAPLGQLSEELQSLLKDRAELEGELKKAETAHHNHNQYLKDLENQRHKLNDRVNELQKQLQSLAMESQAIQIRQTTIQEQVAEANIELETLLRELPEEANTQRWQERIEKLVQQITRLGPINLAAIEEYQTINERKEYLDKQNADLIEALSVLENAIRKIDQETRAKFRETFDRVNAQFQELFPRIFIGGKATLELSDDDLLSAGVIVRAQPPGKRNATIHMLSGGEKALTAVALVFSFFQLNPAPFCILDEVDAPLDDSNTVRFCQLVKEISTNIQFIVISHNKLTIETADYLMGVTMQEPGVSRLVAVDVKQAIEMATT